MESFTSHDLREIVTAALEKITTKIIFLPKNGSHFYFNWPIVSL